MISTTQEQESWVLWVDSPPELARYIAKKGSITMDGVSLTVNEVDGTRFRVNIVPFTAEHTTLCTHAPGSGLNLEVDLIARYLERMLGVDNASDGGMTRARLESVVSGGGGEK